MLSALLHDNRCARHLATLKPDDFAHDTNGQIFRHAMALIARDEPARIDTVYADMAQRRRPRPAGLFDYLRALYDLGVVPANVGYYAAHLRAPDSSGRARVVHGQNGA